MREYTEKIHRPRLVKMLQKNEPCERCPAAPYYIYHMGATQDSWSNNPCVVCKVFIGSSYGGFFNQCPCSVYGNKKAIKLTIAALKNKGDL